MDPITTTQRPAPFTDGGELQNTAVQYPVTVGLLITQPSVIATRDISYVIDCVRQGVVEGNDLRAQIGVIRTTADKAVARQLKAQLPYFLGSVCRRYRSNEAVEKARFMIFDLDGISDPAAVKAEALAKLPFLRWAFVSPGGKGVKLIAQLDRDITLEAEYRELWAWLALQVNTVLGIEPDSTPDWARACFFSYDPELLTNAAFKPVAVNSELLQLRELSFAWQRESRTLGGSKEATDGHHTARENPASEARITSPEEDFARAREVVAQLAQIRIPYHEWVKVGFALYSAFGEPGRSIWYLFQSNPHYRDTAADLAKQWRSFRSVRNTTLGTLFYIAEQHGIKVEDK